MRNNVSNDLFVYSLQLNVEKEDTRARAALQITTRLMPNLESIIQATIRTRHKDMFYQ